MQRSNKHSLSNLCILCALGLAALLCALMFKNWGVHVDENIYLGTHAPGFGDGGIFGDTKVTGKPFLFYSINYIWVSLLGGFFGHLKYVSLYLAYILLHLVSNLYLCNGLSRLSQNKKILLFLLLISSPFLFLSSMQLMTEGFLVPMCILSFAAMVRIQKDPSRQTDLAILLLSVIAAVWAKPTAVPAILILLFGFWSSLPARTVATASGAILIGLGISKVSVDIISRYRVDFGGVNEIFNSVDLIAKLDNAPLYLWTWAFYLNPLALLLLLYLLVRRSQLLKEKEYCCNLRIIVLSALAVFTILLLQKIQLGNLARYTYPSIAMGLLATTIILVQNMPRLTPLLFCSFLVPIGNLYGLTGQAIDYWPLIVRDELYNSGWTILPGAPVLRWSVMTEKETLDKLCIYSPVQNSERPRLIKELFEKLAPTAKFYSEETKAEFDKCLGPKGYLIRQYLSPTESCARPCPAGVYSLEKCTVQDIRVRSESSGGQLTNQICLP